jgi:hypothetical protein
MKLDNEQQELLHQAMLKYDGHVTNGSYYATKELVEIWLSELEDYQRELLQGRLSM